MTGQSRHRNGLLRVDERANRQTVHDNPSTGSGLQKPASNARHMQVGSEHNVQSSESRIHLFISLLRSLWNIFLSC